MLSGIIMNNVDVPPCTISRYALTSDTVGRCPLVSENLGTCYAAGPEGPARLFSFYTRRELVSFVPVRAFQLS